jgi:phosphoribosylaminoimidazole carboxylase PurE protein
MSNGNLETAKVVILMGSDSDLPRMKQCLSSLEALEVPYDIRVASAHRTPQRVKDIVERGEAAGVEVFICAAGGAAHLAGAVAAHTTLPVIGVPLAVAPLQGVDALHATVQMPPGLPVATVAVGDFGAHNAGILAAQMLAVGDADMKAKVKAHREAMRAKVMKKNATMREELGLPPED